MPRTYPYRKNQSHPKSYNYYVGLQMHKWRLARGIEASTFASWFGWHRKCVWEHENGMRPWTVDKVLKVATALGISHHDLLDGYNPPRTEEEVFGAEYESYREMKAPVVDASNPQDFM